MKIQTLENTSTEDLLLAFNNSFENYFIPLHLSLEQLEFKLQVDNAQLDLSVGMFDDGKLVGFILHGLHAATQTVYNGGTGVIGSHRGKKITKQLYDHTFSLWKERGIQHAQHEVVKENVVAKKIYEDVGFAEHRLLNCMRTKEAIEATNPYEVLAFSGDDMILGWMEDDMIPTWQNSLQSIGLQKDRLLQYLVKEKDEAVGNLLINAASNRILRLNVRKDRRRQGVATALLSHASQKNPNLSVLNLDAANEEVMGFFASRGFDVFLQQYEMTMDMDD
ncbi:MAG: GNAT family N-acetyltransferase [Bacteroidota bacterium]